MISDSASLSFMLNHGDSCTVSQTCKDFALHCGKHLLGVEAFLSSLRAAFFLYGKCMLVVSDVVVTHRDQAVQFVGVFSVEKDISYFDNLGTAGNDFCGASAHPVD